MLDWKKQTGVKLPFAVGENKPAISKPLRDKKFDKKKV
jgi:hypothetical protein